MADHSYLLCKVLGWKSNSPDSWASVSHAQEVLNIDVSWKKPSLQIEPIWAPHDCVGHRRIFPWRAFPSRLLSWAVADEGSDGARSCQVLPGVGDKAGGQGQSQSTGRSSPGHWAPPARLSGTHGRAWLWGAGIAMGVGPERAAKHQCRLCKGFSPVSCLMRASALAELRFSKA